MNILWLCNIPLPKIAAALSWPVPVIGGWVAGMAEGVLRTGKYKLTVCFPQGGLSKPQKGEVDGIDYYAFPATGPHGYDSRMELWFKEIIADVKPGMVHIFGTEFPHSLAITKVFARPERTVINLQGMSSIIARHYMGGVPEKIQRKSTLRDFIRRQNLRQSQQMFSRRGEYEKQALRNAGHFIGRTTWDRACSNQINSDAAYHFCNETLRNEFYLHRWNIDKCKRYSILISQCGVPLKGLHYMLEAMPEILKRYPQAHLYVTGNNPAGGKSLKSRFKTSYYGKYLTRLIKKYDLQGAITFTGLLDEKVMCRQFLASHVFVSPSTIENESNSLSEAKILGVPSVASYVGGVTDRIKNGVDGFIYQHDAPYMAAYYICRIFADDKLALKLSENAVKAASAVNDRKVNATRIAEIYNDITGN